MAKFRKQEEMSEKELKIIKRKCEKNLYFFMRYFFAQMTGIKWIDNWHHEFLSSYLQENVVTHKVTRLIVNLPPRYSKTEIFSVFFIAWSIMREPRAKFIHLSYDNRLAQLNSSRVKAIIETPEFQQFWPHIKIKKDNFAKKEWYIEKYNGGIYSVSSGAGVTGFGAGVDCNDDDNTFYGAIIIDDPNKIQSCLGTPEQVKKYTDFINHIFTSVVMNRVNNTKKTPIIVIQQRIVENDLSGFLLKGGAKQKFELIKLPVIDEDGDPLWEKKHNLEQIEMLKSDRSFNGQYMQSPQPGEDDIIIKEKWFVNNRYKKMPIEFDKIVISMDTANKDKEVNDPTAILVFGLYGKRWYLIDCICKKMKYPELKKVAKQVIQKYCPNEVLVEDKSSGISLIQDLEVDEEVSDVPIIAMQTGKQNKVMRMDAGASQLEVGQVVLPEKAPWLFDLETEWFSFPNSANFDRVDALSQFLKRIRKENEMMIY